MSEVLFLFSLLRTMVYNFILILIYLKNIYYY